MNSQVERPPKPALSSRQRFRDFRREARTGVSESDPDQESVLEDKAPEDEDEKKRKRRHYLLQYRRWLGPYKFALSFIFLLAAFAMAMQMVLPMATRHIIDEILLPGDIEAGVRLTRLHTVAALVLAALLVSHVVGAYRMYRMTVLNARIVFSLRERLFARLIKLPLGEIAGMKSGGIVSRLSNDVDNVRGIIQQALISPGVSLLQVITTLGILLAIQWQLALAAAAMLPPLTLVSLTWVRKARPIYRSMAKDRSHVDARVAETFGGIRVVRSFLRERKEELDYAVGHHSMIRKKVFADLIGIAVHIGWTLIIPLVSLIIIWFGGLLYVWGLASVGDIVAFEMYSGMLLYPVWRIVENLSEVQRSLASMDRVFEVLEMETDKPDRPGARGVPGRVEEIGFDGVDFSYKEGKEVLHGVNLTFKGGETVAFVGPSGAGKTTITDLIARFYDPTAGRVLLNGTDLRDFRLEDFRRLLGIVQQDVFLFDGTVRENIAYGNRQATDEQVRVSAEKAGAHEFIMELKNGYDTLIGERGVKLSGGQRQRLSIARAILADPQILILDEATSNLDTESEQKIQDALKELFSGRTTFVIAHRLSTVTHAQQIVVIEQGRVVETGNHETLMAAQGPYFRMVERQRQSMTI